MKRDDRAHSAGFTMMEIIVSIGITILIFALGTSAFLTARRKSDLKGLGDSIVSSLELAKANAMASLNGDPFGMNFGTSTGTSSYIYFEGSSFNSADNRNKTYSISSPYTLFATTTPSGGIIIFARLSGTPSATGTVTVADPSDPTHPQIITVGSLGDITISR